MLHNLKQSEHHKSTIFQQYIFFKSTSVSTAEKFINAQILFTEHFRFSRSFQAHGGFLAFLFTLAIVSVCQVVPGEFPVDRGA